MEPERGDRVLGLAVSVALHLFLLALFAGGGSGNESEHGATASRGNGMALGFVEIPEFRQRIAVTERAALAAATPVDAGRSESLARAGSVPSAALAVVPAERAEVGGASPGDSGPRRSSPSGDNPTTMAPEMAGTEVALGAGRDIDLHTAYLAALRAAIRLQWGQADRHPGKCRLTLQQKPGGDVVSAVGGDCSLGDADRASLEAAALMAQPLPYAGYESAYADSLTLEILDP